MFYFVVAFDAQPLDIKSMLPSVALVMVRLRFALSSASFALSGSNDLAFANQVVKVTSNFVSQCVLDIASLVCFSKQVFPSGVVRPHLRFEFFALWSAILQIMTLAANTKSAVQSIASWSEVSQPKVVCAQCFHKLETYTSRIPFTKTEDIVVIWCKRCKGMIYCRRESRIIEEAKWKAAS
jgi:hypothetical protein